MQIAKTGYNGRTRKEREIIAFVLDSNNNVIDAINPGEGNHKTALDWATWRVDTIRKDYPAAASMQIHCGDIEIAVITLDSEAPTDTPENESEENKHNEKAVISLPRYYTETPERLRFLARSMADQYRGLNDPEAKRMKALYLDIAGTPEYFLKNNLIKAI